MRREIEISRSSKGDRVLVVMDGDHLVSVTPLGRDPAVKVKRRYGTGGKVDHNLPTWAPSKVRALRERSRTR
jgi:hypothetical protein